MIGVFSDWMASMAGWLCICSCGCVHVHILLCICMVYLKLSFPYFLLLHGRKYSCCLAHVVNEMEGHCQACLFNACI